MIWFASLWSVCGISMLISDLQWGALNCDCPIGYVVISYSFILIPWVFV